MVIMRSLVLCLVSLAVVTAVPPPYGVHHDDDQDPKVYRHVYTFAAPDEPVHPESKVIRVPGGDKRVNVILIKTPSSSVSQKTEVILPEQDEQKTIVYVVQKKSESTNDIKIRRPPSHPPKRPEVRFIQYKEQKQTGYPHPSPYRPIYGHSKPSIFKQFFDLFKRKREVLLKASHK